MAQGKPIGEFLLCVSNESYPASLEVRKVYQALSDPVTAARGFVRVIDESGEWRNVKDCLEYSLSYGVNR